MSKLSKNAVIRIRGGDGCPCPCCGSWLAPSYRVCLEWTDRAGQIDLPSLYENDMSSKKVAERVAKFWSELIVGADIEDLTGDKALKAME